MAIGGKRREIYVKELRDYIHILKLSYFYFDEYCPEDKRTLNQIKKVGNYCAKLIIEEEKITKPLLKKISDYTTSMKTFDKKEIQPLGRELLKFGKTVK